jgi:hypothetical protein
MTRRLPLIAATLLLLGPRAEAHDPGLSRGDLRVTADALELTLGFHESDVELATRSGTAAEWRDRLAAGVRLRCDNGDGRELILNVDAPRADQGNGLATRLSAAHTGCERLTLRQPVLSALLPGHRQILVFHRGAGTSTHLISAQSDALQIDARPDANATRGDALAMVREGVRHILIGYDHLVFLALLVLTVLMRGHQRRFSGAETTRQLALVVSAFTLAHSVTLGLAATRVVTVPPGPVEALIALSIVITGVLSLRREGRLDGAALAFGFGLIHGFGFASVFADLVPAGEAVGWAAVAQFNIGVELGQVAIGLPAALVGSFAIRRLAAGLWLARGGALAATAAGAFWLVVRIGSL